MNRLNQVVLILSVLYGSWLGMETVHEFGHMLGAWATGGRVAHVVLGPATISRTDVDPNPRPLIVVWAGPVGGVLLPLLIWGIVAGVRMPGAFVLRFFAGFCLIANGAYIGAGSFGRIGDCGVMLQHGSSLWQLCLFGAITIVAGLALWHRQAKYFGIGPDAKPVSRVVAFASFFALLALLVLVCTIDGK